MRAPLLAVLVPFVLLLAPATARATPEGFFGVSGNRASTADFDKMKEAGVGPYRVLFHMRRFDHSGDQPVFSWRHFDAIVADTARRDLELVPLLYGSPTWDAASEPLPPNATTRDRRIWGRTLVQLVRRYGPGGNFWLGHPFTPYRPVRTWQIWNEPNDAGFFAPRPSAAEYASLLRASAGAIRSVDPDARILSGGIISRSERQPSIRGPAYIKQLLRQPGAIDSIDAIALHPYARSSPGVLRNLRRARAAINSVGGEQLPIWVTEIGWATRDEGLISWLAKGPRRQARALRRTFRGIYRLRERIGIQRALWFQWKDVPTAHCVWCRSAGLLNAVGVPKPAYAAFRQVNGS